MPPTGRAPRARTPAARAGSAPRRLREDAELRAARQFGRLVNLEPEAQVGLVGAVAQLRLVPGHALVRRLELDVEAFAPDPLRRALHQREQLFAVGERHLDVQLRQLLEPVGAQILVPEAAGDLVVALEAGDHEQLLVGLRRLRQREEAAGLQARRDDEVARALGRLLGQDRRLDVDEAGRLHLVADDRDRSRAGADVALHLRAPEIEPAVADPQRLVDVLLVELERQRVGARDDPELVHLQLDLAGRQVRVDRLGRSRGGLALGPEPGVAGDLVRDLGRVGRALGVDHQLRQAALVAQVDEDEPAVVTPPRGPAREGEALPDVLLAQLTRLHVAPLHARSLSASSAVGTSSSGCPLRRTFEVSGAHSTIAFAPRRPAWVSWPFSERPP